MKFRFTYRLPVVVLLFLSSCANVVTPSGGPKDTTPPKVVVSVPENNARNFTSNTLTIDFDEYVVLNNASQNVCFSPPLRQTPAYTLHGKQLMIKLKENLAPNTTYSLMLGDAVKDLHEGNILKDFVLVFSTGDVIDTLIIGGRVLDAQTGKPKEKVWAQLYKSADSVEGREPDYLVQTDKEGKFRFNGLSDGNYTLIAVDDKNSNHIYDLPTEGIAFNDEPLKPVHAGHRPDSTNLGFDPTDITLYMFVHDDSIQQLLKAETVKKGQFSFAFRYPANDSDVVLLGADTLRHAKVWSANRDTVSFFFSQSVDTISVRLTVDTVTKTQKYPVKVRNKRNAKPDNQLVVKTNLNKGKLRPEDDFLLVFDEPVERVAERDSILFIVEKDSLYNAVSFAKADAHGFRYSISRPIGSDTAYRLVLPDSVFFSFLDKTNKPTTVDIRRSSYSEYGSLFVKVVLPAGMPQAVFDLVTESDKKVATQTLTSDGEVKFLDIAPGKYKLRALLDRDANGVWSPGDYSRRLQSEEIICHPQTFDIKADWDIDLDEVWTIGE